VTAPDSHDQIEEELRRANAARAEGNEGRARVCARRAAGAALRDQFLRTTGKTIPTSTVDLLRAAEDLAGLSARGREAAKRLLQKVDEGFNLPQDWDLLVEARILIAELGNRA
jgi:hypothetical protein